MSLLIQQLIELWGPPLGAAVDPDQPVGTICTDSRRIAAGDLFVPLVGERFDGHAFLEQLPARQAQAAVVSRDWAQPLPPELLHWGRRHPGGLPATGPAAPPQLARPLVAVTVPPGNHHP